MVQGLCTADALVRRAKAKFAHPAPAECADDKAKKYDGEG